MKWLHHRKARSDRGAGLAFAWRAQASRLGSTLVAVVVIGLVAVAMATVVKVRVLTPPAHSGQRGTLILSTGDEDLAWLERRGAELTPFPAPLDVRGLEDSERALAEHPALARAGAAGYVPQLRELPEGWDRPAAPVAAGGQFELPPLPRLPAVPAVPEGAGGRRSRPVLAPDVGELAARVPVPVPRFELGAGEEPPGEDPRFMLEVDAAGRVRAVVPLAGAGAAPVVARLERWLRSIRFEPVAGGAGWFSVGVGFVVSGDD